MLLKYRLLAFPNSKAKTQPILKPEQKQWSLENCFVKCQTPKSKYFELKHNINKDKQDRTQTENLDIDQT